MRRVFVFIAIVISVWSIAPTAAQTPGQTPTAAPSATQPPFNVETKAEIAFPYQVFFQANIKLNITQIAGVSLVIETINNTRVEIDYPEEPFLFASDEVIATYVWDIPRDNPLPLFRPLRYTWRITTTSGQTVSEVKTLDFTDERVTWQTITAMDDALTLVAPQAVTRGVGSLQVELTETLKLLQQKTGQVPQVRLLIYDDTIPMGCSLSEGGELVYQAYNREGVRTEKLCDPAQAEAIYQESDFTVLQLGTDRNMIESLMGPLVREGYAPLWAGKTVPLWFSVGLEQFYQRQPNREALFISREAMRGDTPFTLAQMNSEPTLDNTIVWTAQAYGMVLYLASRIGVENVFALARDIAEAESFEVAYQARVGSAPDGLVGAWQTWVFKREAENAYLYTPYLATTPTPTLTVTPTDTDIPPTETLTPTATRDLSPTPRLTITRRPPTPTITPLPASSFNLRPTAIPPTPIDNSPIAIASRGNNPIIIIGGVVLAILLVILISLITGPRR
jgi:hypothetical protein